MTEVIHGRHISDIPDRPEAQTEHVCVWELKAYLYVGVPIFGCKIKGCHEKLAVRQAEARLNATGALSAEMANSCADSVMCHQHDRCAYDHEIAEVQKEIDALRAYADAREGK